MRKATLKGIIHAFIELLHEKTYDEITIEDIVKEACISKTTFYRYFRDKADVMDRYFQETYDQAILNHECNSLQDLFAILLQNAKDHSEQYEMFKTSGYNSFSEFIYRYTYKMGSEIMQSAWNRELSETEHFHVSFFCAGGCRIIKEWSSGRSYPDMSAREAAAELCQMINPKYQVSLDAHVRNHLIRIIEQRYDS